MNTLPDVLSPGLRLLSIGLNPSLPSVEAGFYFANPRNRFWQALNASRLLSVPVEPGPAGMQVLLEREGVGFTDLVKRPSRGVANLRIRDYREGSPRLLAAITRTGPAIAWFHGKIAWKQFRRFVFANDDSDEWGLQEMTIAGSRIFVSPNPSPANAAFSLDDLIASYDQLADCL